MEVEESALRKKIEHQEDEINRLQDTVEDHAASVENLNVRLSTVCLDSSRLLKGYLSQRLLAEATSGISGGKEFAQAVQELEKVKRNSELQVAEFESTKRNLFRDISDRCEKVRKLCSLMLLTWLILFVTGH
jgi:uncharacterized protein Yka (UPF0111/DUF47 family)